MIRVVIVDDQKVVTQGLKALLGSEPDIQIVGTGANGQDAIDLVASLLPDVLLIDQYMPIMDGVQATLTIRDRFPQVAVLLLSGSDQDNHISAALQAGAKGYLLKSTSAEDLANSIRSVDRGYSQMGPGLLEKLLAQMTPSPSGAMSLDSNPQTLLSSDLAQILSLPTQFDVVQMTRLLDITEDVKVAATLMAQLEQRIQQNPTHVSALYLSGRLIAKFQTRDQLTLKYLRLALTHAQNQSFPPLVPFHICHAAWIINAPEALMWLTEMLSHWPTNQPYRIWFEHLAQVFDSASDPYRRLKVSWETEQLNFLCDQVNGLKSKLSALDIIP